MAVTAQPDDAGTTVPRSTTLSESPLTIAWTCSAAPGDTPRTKNRTIARTCGALVHGLPRALGSGATFTEINLLDFGVGLGDIALAWCVVWLLLRLIGELRA